MTAARVLMWDLLGECETGESELNACGAHRVFFFLCKATKCVSVEMLSGVQYLSLGIHLGRLPPNLSSLFSGSLR